ncbi:MAG: arginyltransferase [Deltaproteobacteria bacterium]|nr:arginyltransferase [Deltaproteobacteria bacterium]
MARLLQHWLSAPSQCSYLPDQLSSLEYRLMLDVSPEELEHLLARGWRRFGPAYFRPGCARCSECVPLRVPVQDFVPSRSQRRVARRTEGLRMVVGRPQVDAARLELYHRWHASQGAARGWPEDRIDVEEYYHQFAFPHPSVREAAYYDDAAPGGPRLVGVAIMDETPESLSAVYTYHDPDYHRDSLGTASVLRQIDEARRRGKRWVYLGYRVMGCASSRYKARFRPHELLDGWPELNEAPRWRLVWEPEEPLEVGDVVKRR